MNIREMHQRNRLAWNEAAEGYEQKIERDIEFLRAGGTNFVAPEYRYLQDLGSWCGRAIHLQCAGGRDTLSLWNLGAAEVVGVDISERMIACARRKSEALGAPAQWFCYDVLETPSELNGTADLVYTGRGALCWMMDIAAWAQVVHRLLKPGGRLYVFEGHPFTYLWDMEAAELKLDAQYGDYFQEEVILDVGWPETYLPDLSIPPQEQTPKYERVWKIGDVMNALIAAGLRVERFEEHPDPYFIEFANLPADIARRFPHTFSLLMQKD